MKRPLIFAALVLPLLAAGDGAATLRHVGEAYTMTSEDASLPIGFDFSGMILLNDKRNSVFRDDTGGMFLNKSIITNAPWSPGDIIRIRGSLSISPEEQFFFFVERSETIGRGKLPNVDDVSLEELSATTDLFRFVRTRGVVASAIPDDIDARYYWFTLQSPMRTISVSIPSSRMSMTSLRSLIDAEVEVEGLLNPASGWRRHMPPHIYMDDNAKLTVLRPPPGDVFAAPAVSTKPSAHRQRTSGVVLASCADRFFIRTPADRFVTAKPSAEAPRPPPGSRVTVAGFARYDPFRLQLDESAVHIDGKCGQLPGPEAQIDVEFLFADNDGTERICADFHGRIISVQGTIDDAPGQSDAMHIALRKGQHVVSVDVSAFVGGGAALPAPGSKVCVTGLCLTEFDNSRTATTIPPFRNFLLVPRTASDIEVVANPPWWTPTRLLMLVAALIALLAGSGVWNFMLNRRAERRCRELYDERMGHALAEQKVEERTRLAVELHDSVSQTLTGVALQLDGGEVETAKAMLASCRGELRRCLWDLRSRTFEEKDMTEAIERTIAPYLDGVEARVKFDVPTAQLPESTTHTILQIVRELVVNATRHGMARHVDVSGGFHDNTIAFSVRDDGCGFDTASAPGPEQGHFGLLGVRERLEEFNGRMEITSAPGAGTLASVTMSSGKDEYGA